MGIDTIRKLVSRKSVNTFLDAKVRLKLDAMVYTFVKKVPSPPKKAPSPPKKSVTPPAKVAPKRGAPVADDKKAVNPVDATIKKTKSDEKIVKVLQNESTGAFHVWNRWGRVGVPGQNCLKGAFPKETALRDYISKVHEKTVKGDYKEIEIKYDDEEEPKVE
ncbi:unnamed protein product [Sphagnum balticum]